VLSSGRGSIIEAGWGGVAAHRPQHDAWTALSRRSAATARRWRP